MLDSNVGCLYFFDQLIHGNSMEEPSTETTK